jgi:double-stranded uracil-DNA glycosylase
MVEVSLNCLKYMAPKQTSSAELPDYLETGLHILFVGINPGLRSAQVGHHFAGYSNRFWKLLHASSLVPEPLTYHDDWRLPEWHLGVTNIISRSSSGIDALSPDEYRRGQDRLERMIRRYRPRVVAFLGVTIFRILFPDETDCGVGSTEVHLAHAPVFLLPNPSGRNAHYSYDRMVAAFCDLRETAAQPALYRARPRPLSDPTGLRE